MQIHLSPAAAAREVRTQLESVRRLLIDNPSSFSLITAGAALESVTGGLFHLQQALEKEAHQPVSTRSEVLEVLALSGRVNFLYRQAAGFYTTLAQPAPDLYSPSGEFPASVVHPGAQLKLEG